MNLMICIAWFASAFSAAVLAAGFYILFKNTKKKINIIFFLICVDAAVLIILLSIQHFIADKTVFLAVYNIVIFLSYIFLPLNIHFYLELSAIKGCGNAIKPLVYLFSLAMFILSMAYKFPFSDYIRIDDKYWKFVIAANPGFYAYLAFASFSQILCLGILIRWRKRSALTGNKKQASVLITSLVLFMIIGLGSFFTFPHYHNSELLPLILLLIILIYLFAILYSLLRYDFLTLDYKKILGGVFANINEYVFLLNTKFEIISANKSARKLYNKKDKAGIRYPDLTNDPENVKNIFFKLIDNKTEKINSNVSYKINDKDINTVSHFSAVTDKYNDISALLIISKEEKNIDKFRTDFKISAREFDVVKLTGAGLSVRGIAERLGISARTVETHYVRLYARLNIKNKIELMNIYNQYR